MAFNNNFPNNIPNFNPQQINPNIFNAYQNIFNMNPNFNMQNQAQLNPMLMNFFYMNPNLFNNNPNINMNNKGFQAFGPVNNMGTGIPGGNLPRRVSADFDCYPGYIGPRINVIFEVSTGPKINIAAPPSESVEGLLIKFCQRAGVNPSLLKKEIVCVYNATFINPTNKTTIQQFLLNNMGLNDQAKIIVIDAQNIIGA